MSSVKFTAKVIDGGVVVPPEMMALLGLKAGDPMHWVVMDGVAQLTPDPNALAIPMLLDPKARFQQQGPMDNPRAKRPMPVRAVPAPEWDAEPMPREVLDDNGPDREEE